MILVLLGTQHNEFTRLLQEVENCIDNQIIIEQVIVQAGFTKYKSNKMEIFDMISKEELDKYMSKANLVITHGGVGSIIMALEKGKKVIAVPRLHEYGEHVNDHQRQIIKVFSEKNYLIGIMNSTLETDKLKKQIDDLKKADPIDTKKIADLTTQISQLEVKITKNKDLLMGIKGLDFKDEDLKELLDNGIVVNKNGKIDLAVTLNNRRAQLNRQVKKYTKSITEHEKALETLGRSTSEQTSSEPSQHQSPTRITRTEPAQDSNSEQSHETENSSEPAQEGSEQEEKPKWYQFVKRFKIWNEKRKQKALPEAEQPELTPENNPQPKNNFKNALKYDIVKDLYKQADKQALKDARSKGKEEASFETPISQDQDGDER